ncbi:AraC family transcriptional regulator [Paenibacillus sp. PDC88]|uniref:helix-turn-helix transcriptional regulator n=1 Tax=Paenibacillus sp. PDC88 TaxID=1884375 RepID=UPI00089D68EC|nr:AraC family transcriptional regulator [Paenibacillus sp. PDC88]SDX57577.1 transcriptional regulator, AraC family [Paenibacillus sp. PDC88]
MNYLKINGDQPVHFLAAGEFISETEWIHLDRIMGVYELIIGVEETVYIEEDDTQYEINRGDILLLQPGHRHRGYRASKPGVKFYWFHFDCPKLPQILSSSEMEEESLSIHSEPVLAWTVSDLFLPQYASAPYGDRIHIIVNQILHVANSSYYTKQSVHYLMTSLLIEISELTLQRLAEQITRVTEGKSHFVKMMEWTKLHAAEPLTVNAIALKFNYHQDSVSRMFKQYTGMGPLAYIHQIRMEKAKGLLTRTSLSIKEVAEESGYPDEKYFMRLFKRTVNMTPTQFRNAYHQTFMNNV